MSKNKLRHKSKLSELVKLSLFCSSFVPLFFIIILKQFMLNIDYLSFGGFSSDAIYIFFEKFGLIIFLSIISLYGLLGSFLFVHNVKISTENNGTLIKITKIQNKNNESIGYIATYLIPFVFQSFSTPFEIISFLTLLVVIYIIYTHSTLFVVNPLLNLRYSLYDIQYLDIKADDNKVKEGTFIIDCHYVKIDDILNSRILDSNIFFGTLEENDNEKS